MGRTQVRYEEHYERTPILAAVGVTLAGDRELLGFTVGDKESTEAWKSFLQELKSRGLEKVRLFITDGAPGLIHAIEELFLNAVRQRCIRHRMQNVLGKVPQKLKEKVATDLKKPFYQNGYEEAKQEAQRFFERWEAEVPEAAECLKEHLEECLLYYKFPREHWKYIRTTNCLESVFSLVKRRTKAMGSFRNETSVKLVAYALFRRMTFRGVPIQKEFTQNLT
jgi:transposase-like protein